MAAHWFRIGEFRQDAVCQLLAEFDAPLIERIDIPDDALYENLVLIQCNQRTQGLGVELAE